MPAVGPAHHRGRPGDPEPRFRDQAKNIEDCREKLRAMVLEVLHPPRPRKVTKPSKGSKRRRLEAKRQQSQRKAGRRKPSGED